jgi:hypothetical protein
MCLFHMIVRISKETPSTHEASDSLIEVKPFTALLHMILVGILSYLQSVLRYKYPILDIYNLDTVFT